MKKYFVVSRISENMHETPEGFLLCLGVPIARAGLQTYGEGETPLETGSNGTIDIDRSPEEVFRPQTIASFEGKPVTITHPHEFVSPENWSGLAKGVVQNVRRGTGDQKDDLIADLLITDKMAIDLVKNGLREVSCGYEAEYTQTGEGKGTQANIVGNHVALVDEGRAGSEYAIKDHKGVKMDKKTLLEKIKTIFGKGQDEAMKMVQDAFPEEGDKDKDKSKDAPGAGYDELVKMVKDLTGLVSGMANPTTMTDAEKAEKEKADAEQKAKDAEPMMAMEERMKKLEAAVAQLLENKADAGDEDPEEGEEVVGDEEMDDDLEDGDGVEDAACTGDTASRVEILAPGLEAKGKDIKAKALKACYSTKDGKKLIESLNGGKAPAFDSADKVNMLFTAASELLKASRNRDMSKTKQARDAELVEGTPNDRVMTAEKMNELNEKHYKRS